MADTRTDEEKTKACMATRDALAKIRLPFEPMVDDILTYVHHSRRRVNEDKSQRGRKTGTDIYDGTAFHALNLLSDGLAGYSCSRAFRWFEYTLPGKLNFPRWSGMKSWSGKRMDEFPEVKRWLEDCEEVLYQAFLRSNFYDLAPEMIKEAASVGTVTVMVEEDVRAGRIIFTIPHFRECFVAENIFGLVDTNYRESYYTLKQLVEKFGIERMEEVKPGFTASYEKNMHDELLVLHAVYPRSDFDPEMVNAKNKPFASIWLLKDAQGPNKIIAESGYNENPAVTWRWKKNSDEWYGRSPCWDAFVEIMTANQQAKTNLIAGHKMAEPPMVSPSDLRGMVQSGPRGWTYIDGKITKDNVPVPLVTGIQLPYALEMQDRTKQIIRDHLFVDFFLMLSQVALENKNLTATQVVEMAGEKAAILGPRIGRMESEAFNPIHDRMFAIEKRARRIPKPPAVLLEYAGANIEVDYMGPLSQSQKKLFKSQGIRGGLGSLAEMMQIDPLVKYVIEPFETARLLLEAQGFPSKALRNEDDLKKAIAVAYKQAQEQQMLSEALATAQAVPAAGKAPEEGSPLALLTENAGLE